MILAHITDSGAGGGGSGAARWVALLAGLAALAWAARWRTTGQSKLQWVAAGVLAAVLVVGALVWPVNERDPIYLTVLTPEPGTLVPANQPVPIDVRVEGARVAESENDRTGGHLHLYVDGRLEQMPYTTKPTVTLPPGRHDVKVEFVDERHVAYDPPVEVVIPLDAR